MFQCFVEGQVLWCDFHEARVCALFERSGPSTARPIDRGLCLGAILALHRRLIGDTVRGPLGAWAASNTTAGTRPYAAAVRELDLFFTAPGGVLEGEMS